MAAEIKGSLHLGYLKRVGAYRLHLQVAPYCLGTHLYDMVGVMDQKLARYDTNQRLDKRECLWGWV